MAPYTSLPPGEARYEWIKVRVKPAEKALFEAAAQKASMDLSALIRSLVFATLAEAQP